MALIQFSCIATGPFITFKETAERIFEALGEPFHEHGAFAAEDLPSILAKLDAAAAADRKLEQEIEIERENGFVQDLTMLSFGRLRLKKNKLTKPSIMKTRSAFING